MTKEKPIASLSALRAWSFGFIKCCRKDLPQPVYDENGQAWRGVTDESYVGRLPEYDRTENIENQEPVENTRRVVKNASVLEFPLE